MDSLVSRDGCILRGGVQGGDNGGGTLVEEEEEDEEGVGAGGSGGGLEGLALPVLPD